MKTDINDVLRDAEEQLENSNKLLIIGVIFIIATSIYLAYHSWHIFFDLAGGEKAGNGAYFNASVAVGCVEGSLIALIICHFLLFTTDAQKWIGLAGDGVTYAFLLFHAALNFRQNLFGYLDGFGDFYRSNGLPVLVFGVTLLTWAGILLLDVRAKMRLKTIAALSSSRERELKSVLRDRATIAPTPEPQIGYTAALDRVHRGPKAEADNDPKGQGR